MGIIINEGTVTPSTPSAPSVLCNYANLVNEVAFFLYGLRPTATDVITEGVATTAQATDILRAIAKGLQFIYSAYRWSFLRQLVSITTYPAYVTGTITVDASGNVTGTDTVFPSYSASANGRLYIPSVGTYLVATRDSDTALTLTDYNGGAITSATIYSLGFNTYPLPSGVDSLEGPLTYPPGSDWPPVKLDRVPELEIRRLLIYSVSVDRPRIYAETMDTFDPTVGSTRYVTLFPVPDDEYLLTAVGTIRPQMIDVTNQYPLGIEVLSPCIAESCLAAAERDMDDAEGVHNRALVPLLEMAIQRDKEYSSPDTLGIDRGQESCDDFVQRRSTSIYWDAGGYTGYL
jgi:hypothetical protein